MPTGRSENPHIRAPDRRAIVQVLAAARANFDAAQVGYHDLVGPESWRRLPGLRNAIVQSVGVSHALQNLRHLVPDFDAWWDAKVAEMRAEPILAYVYPLRTQMLKQARDPNVVGDPVITVEIDQVKLAELESHPPPGARRFQINWTGATFTAAWMIDNGDGSIRMEEVPMPGTVTGAALHFPNAPTVFRGRVFDNTAANILSIYTGYARGVSPVAARATRHLGHRLRPGVLIDVRKVRAGDEADPDQQHGNREPEQTVLLCSAPKTRPRRHTGPIGSERRPHVYRPDRSLRAQTSAIHAGADVTFKETTARAPRRRYRPSSHAGNRQVADDRIRSRRGLSPATVLATMRACGPDRRRPVPTCALLGRPVTSRLSISTDRDRREPAPCRSGECFVSGARFSLKASVGISRAARPDPKLCGSSLPARNRSARACWGAASELSERDSAWRIEERTTISAPFLSARAGDRDAPTPAVLSSRSAWPLCRRWGAGRSRGDVTPTAHGQQRRDWPAARYRNAPREAVLRNFG
jgi:hypothetical protein